MGANAWPFYFTMDEERDLLYLPLASPIPGEYGGDRPGANLFGNSVVAVNVHTGEYVWHFQTIHHDLWDADPPAPPVLFDISGDGSTTPALGLTTKSGYLYILNRETGEPIFGVEERPVAESEAPGEEAFPTQPIPIKPPPMARVSYEPGDLVTAEDTTAEHAAACAAFVENAGELYNAGPFTPWLYRPDGAPPRATLLFPGTGGRSELGWRRVRSRLSAGDRVLAEPRFTGLVGRCGRGFSGALSTGGTPPEHLRRGDWWHAPAVSEATVGSADGR